MADRIAEAFYKLFAKDKPRKEHELYVTEIIWCPRKAWFSYMFGGIRRPNVDMIEGIIHHDLLPKLPVWEGMNARFEIPVTYDLDGWTIAGRADVITENPEAIWEFKFPQRVGNENIRPMYVMQLTAYLEMFDMDQGYLVEVEINRSRNSIKAEILPVERNEGVWNRFLDLARELIGYIEREELPTGPRLDFECLKCPYRPICKHIGAEVRLE